MEGTSELSQIEKVAERFHRLEARIERTGELFRQLVKAQGDPIRLDYTSGTRYMCLFRQRDRSDNTIGAYWRVFLYSSDKRRIWKKGWHPQRVPPAVKKRMDERNYERFSELSQIAKAICVARSDLVKKKQRVLATLQKVESVEDPRMREAEELIDEFVL